MKLESVLARLGQIKARAEASDYDGLPKGYIEALIIATLVQFIGNKKIEEYVNEIPF